ncbi:restin homolog isoform X4 [Harmonia axyridis]|uniref:restin homolog isoform X4 n=1 Tax=Harmonia axyridis TaxID=115357 RepID=UPI001E278264|nr:restin homolog isoform X4 [Harmonia axyridis]
MSNNNGDDTLNESEMKPDETDSSAKGSSEKCLQRSMSALSVSSIASSTSSIPLKRSGLKPPSRIGRPCDGQQHKPAVPSSPSAHNLLEEDTGDYLRFSSMSPYRRRYSSTGSSSSSMDHLWELYPHRLREAGLNRYSDSSTVLTQDTDSFIIGQRIWVGGTKPGTIAFIGETQFAPGEWAGIVLDEAVGKNDGSVAGVRYFQCEAKKGVFSRLTRLTRQPLEVPQSNEMFSTPLNGVRSPVSPTGSTRSLLRSPMSHHASNTSLASMSTSVIIDYKLGDRVIIKSSQGSKVGTVRFIGYTEFAAGEWVGVELDDPRGKNDGSVEGKRYFTCQPNFGLFAPIGKVSKSPSKIKPGSCAVHNSGGLPPSGLRRSGSKESMTSVASSIRRVRLGVNSLTPKKLPLKSQSPAAPRPSLQDMVKEKQQHIEQLLKERDLERQEFTKAANQAEEAEQQLTILKKEFDAYRAECDVKLQEHMLILTELKKDRTELLGQLEDEKKKNEDLLFKFEEASILKSDAEAMVERRMKEIDELQKLLDIERSRNDDTEKNSNKLFETEESLIKANEEIEKLKSELDNLTLQQKSLGEDKVLATEQTELLEKELDITKKQLGELNSIRNTLSQQLTSASLENVQVKESLEELKQKLKFYENEIAQKNNEISNFNSELEATKKNLSENENLVQKLQSDQSKEHADLNKELEKLKMEMSSKTFDMETINDELKKKQDEIAALLKSSEEMKLSYEAKINENLKLHQENAETLNKELHQVKEDLNNAKEEITKLSQTSEEKSIALIEEKQQLEKELENIKADIVNSAKKTEEQSLLFESKMKENEEKIENYEKEIKSLKEELDKLKETGDSLNSELQNEFEEYERKSKYTIESLQGELITKDDQINLIKSECKKFKLDLDMKSNLLDTVTNSMQIASQESSTLKEENQKLLNHIRDLRNSLEKQSKDVEIQKKSAISSNTELQDQLKIVKQENANLIESLNMEKEKISSLSSGYEKLQHDFDVKSTQLQSAENSLKTITEQSLKLNEDKQQLDLHNGDLKRSIESLERKLEDVEIQKNKMYEEIRSLINSSGDNSAQLEEMRTKLFENQTLLDKTKNEYQNKIQDLERQIQEKNLKLEEKENHVLKIEKEYSETKESSEAIIVTNTNRVRELLEEINKIKESHIREIEDHHKKLTEKETHLEKIKKDYEEKLNDIEITIEEKTSKLKEKECRIMKLERKCSELDASKTNLDKAHQQAIEEMKKQIEDIKGNHDQQLEKKQNEIRLKEEEQNRLLDTIHGLQSNLEMTLDMNRIFQETTDQEYCKLKSTIEKMETALSEKSSENEQLKHQLDTSQTTLQKKDEEIEISRIIIEQKERVMTEKLEELEKKLATSCDESSIKISDLNNVNEILKKEVEKTNKELQEINLKFKEYRESIEMNSNNNEQNYINQISSLESKVKELNVAIEETNKQKQNTEKLFNEKCLAYDANTEEITKLVEKINIYEEKLKGIEEEKLSIRGALELSNNNLQEKDKHFKELNDKIEIMNEKYKLLENALSEEKLKNIELQSKNEKGEILQNEFKELANQLQVVTDKLKEYESQKCYMLEALQNLKFTPEQKKNLIAIFAEKEAGDLQKSILKLQDDYVDASTINKIKELEQCLEKSKLELNEERRKFATQSTEMFVLEQKLKSVAINKNNVITSKQDEGNNSQLLEDKLLAENQVKFLNSIIVDMQKKNEEQKAKIEILESGYSPAAADELNLMGFSSSSRQLAPRVYCDICDCFDLHETEDCPKQMSEDMPPPPPTDKIKKKPEPRPYCELCEVFGHDTQECTEDETF